MRNLDTPVKQIRRKIFTEIAKIGFESTDESMIHDIESIPYNIVEERAKYRESIYRERAVASERVRLAMGLSLRPENRSVHLTDGVKASNIDEKYYEPPLMQVIPSACSACRIQQIRSQQHVPRLCRTSLFTHLPQRRHFHGKRKILHRPGQMYPLRKMQSCLSLRCHRP